MSLHSIPLNLVGISEVKQLVEAGMYEMQKLDWKRQLPGTDQASKREFVQDVAAMANGGGGDLVFGVEEDPITSKPANLCGVLIDNWDTERLRLQQLILTGIQPRIIGFDIQYRELTQKAKIVIVRIPKSVTSPHMVTHDGINRFVVRHPGGRHPMDISEVRHAFIRSLQATEKSRIWSDTRLDLIEGNKASLPIEQGPIVALHIVPIGADVESHPFTLIMAI